MNRMSLFSDRQPNQETISNVSWCDGSMTTDISVRFLCWSQFSVSPTVFVRGWWHWRACRAGGRAALATAGSSHSWLWTVKCWTWRTPAHNQHRRGRGCPRPGAGTRWCWWPPWSASWPWSWGRRGEESCSEAACSRSGRSSDSEYNFIKISAWITTGPGKLNVGWINKTKEGIVLLCTFVWILVYLSVWNISSGTFF